MPQIAEDVQNPTVMPETRGISAEATPAEAGAGVGEALQRAGAGIEKIGDLYGQVAANNATNNYIDEATKIRSKLMSMSGADAIAYASQAQHELDEAYKNAEGSLWTTQSRLAFAQDTRRYHSYIGGEIADYGAQQQKIYAKDTNNQTLQTADNMAAQAQAAGDTEGLIIAGGLMRKAAVRNAQMEFGMSDTDAVGRATRDADARFAIARINAVKDRDPDTAQKILDNNKAELAGTPAYEALSKEIDESASNRMIGVLSDPKNVANGRAQTTGAAPNPYNLGNVKAAGGTFAQPATPTDGVTLTANTLRESYRGLTLEQIAEKWAPASDHNNPTQWANTVSRASGIALDAKPNLDDPRELSALVAGIGRAEKSAGDLGAFSPQVVKDGVTASLSGAHANLAPARGPNAAGEEPYLQSVRAQAETRFPGRPDISERIVKGVEENIRRDGATQTSQVEESAKDAIAYLNAGGDPAKVALTPDAVRASIPTERGTELADGLEQSLAYSKATKDLATAPQAQIDNILSGKKLSSALEGGPEGFRAAIKPDAAYYAAALNRQKTIFGTRDKPGDPAGYVSQNFPDIAAAFTVASQSGKPADFDAYVMRLNGAYTSLGVPEALRSTLPQASAQQIISTLQSAKPVDSLRFLQGLQADTGRWWPAVYRDLVRDGLPSTFQAPLVAASVSSGNAQVMISALQRDADARATGKKPMAEEARGLTAPSGKPVTEEVDKAISADPGLTSLRATFGVGGRTGVDNFAGVQDAVQATALYLYLSGSVADPAAAASRAAAMVTAPFDFVSQPNHPPARIPKGTTDDFRAATTTVLDGLKAGDVQPYRQETNEAGEPIDVPLAERQAHALEGAKNAFWLAVPGADGRGAVRAFDPATGRPVMLAKGRPLDIPFSQFKALAVRAATEERARGAEAQNDLAVQP